MTEPRYLEPRASNGATCSHCENDSEEDVTSPTPIARSKIKSHDRASRPTAVTQGPPARLLRKRRLDDDDFNVTEPHGAGLEEHDKSEDENSNGTSHMNIKVDTADEQEKCASLRGGGSPYTRYTVTDLLLTRYKKRCGSDTPIEFHDDKRLKVSPAIFRLCNSSPVISRYHTPSPCKNRLFTPSPRRLRSDSEISVRSSEYEIEMADADDVRKFLGTNSNAWAYVGVREDFQSCDAAEDAGSEQEDREAFADQLLDWGLFTVSDLTETGLPRQEADELLACLRGGSNRKHLKAKWRIAIESLKSKWSIVRGRRKASVPSATYIPLTGSGTNDNIHQIEHDSSTPPLPNRPHQFPEVIVEEPEASQSSHNSRPEDDHHYSTGVVGYNHIDNSLNRVDTFVQNEESQSHTDANYGNKTADYASGAAGRSNVDVHFATSDLRMRDDGESASIGTRIRRSHDLKNRLATWNASYPQFDTLSTQRQLQLNAGDTSQASYTGQSLTEELPRADKGSDYSLPLRPVTPRLQHNDVLALRTNGLLGLDLEGAMVPPRDILEVAKHNNECTYAKKIDTQSTRSLSPSLCTEDPKSTTCIDTITAKGKETGTLSELSKKLIRHGCDELMDEMRTHVQRGLVQRQDQSLSSFIDLGQYRGIIGQSSLEVLDLLLDALRAERDKPGGVLRALDDRRNSVADNGVMRLPDPGTNLNERIDLVTAANIVREKSQEGFSGTRIYAGPEPELTRASRVFTTPAAVDQRADEADDEASTRPRWDRDARPTRSILKRQSLGEYNTPEEEEEEVQGKENEKPESEKPKPESPEREDSEGEDLYGMPKYEKSQYAR